MHDAVVQSYDGMVGDNNTNFGVGSWSGKDISA